MTEALEKLRAEHGDVRAFDVPGFGMVALAVTAKTRPEYHRLVTALTERGADRGAALERLALSAVVYPSPQDVKDLFLRKPAVASKLAGVVQEMCDEELTELGKD